MKLGVAILTNQEISDIIEMASSAENAGFHHLWIPDGSPAPQFRDPCISLTAIALNTNSIRLGTQLLVPYTIHPARLAVIGAGIAEISKRPFTLGIGVGGSLTLKPLGLPMWNRPLQAMRETFQILRLLFQGETIDFEGKVFNAKKARLEPVPQSRVKFFMGAQSPKMLRLAGEIADGVLLTSPIPYLPTAISEIKRGTEKANRKLSELTICNYMATNVHGRQDRGDEEGLHRTIAFLVADTSDRVHEKSGFSLEIVSKIKQSYRNGEKNSHRYLTDEILAGFSIQGRPEECWEQIYTQEKMGVRQVIIGAPYGRLPIASLKLLNPKELSL
ncbi:MAG: LLM class flavin-dependent oxidoreductase [Candidatus Ranarchaeia archaeon]